MPTTLNELPWDYFDISKPSLWQLSYLDQLKEQTGVNDVEVPLNRTAYGEAISSLKALRTFICATKGKPK